jgi:formylglycine-generating enzyme required for sulfatase activity
MTLRRYSFLPVSLALQLLYGVLAPAQAPAPDRALHQAGVCSRCHVAQVLEWSASRHSHAATVCQTCHGPSAAHVANERNQVKPDRLPRGAAIAATCRTCHSGGCPKTTVQATCESCHHSHALVNPAPAKLAPLDDPRTAKAAEAARHLEAGERHAAAMQWSAALASFRAALAADPSNRRARMRARMCERRLHPGIPGFEMTSPEFDPASGLPLSVRVAALGIEMRLIPGAVAAIGDDRATSSKPAHDVALEPFYVGARELTQGEWNRLGIDNPSTHRDGTLPVNNVSWRDAQQWIAALNSRVPGARFRLPSEAEWEHAAAGVTAEDAWSRANSLRDGLPSRAFHELDAYAPRAAGGRRPGTRGLYDMLGNVWEWTSSLYKPYPYDPRDGREDTAGEGLRVLRGGGYADAPEELDKSRRHGERPGRRQPWNGFRIARSVPE